MGVDTSVQAIWAVRGQCDTDTGKVRVVLYFSAHLSACQQNWHPFEQDISGLLCARRDCMKHLVRIPAILHTSHANITRFDALSKDGIEPKR